MNEIIFYVNKLNDIEVIMKKIEMIMENTKSIKRENPNTKICIEVQC